MSSGRRDALFQRKRSHGLMSALLSIPDRLFPLQNCGKPTFVQPTAQGQLLGSIGKGPYGWKVVATRQSVL